MMDRDMYFITNDKADEEYELTKLTITHPKCL